jgi:hypothetical protein
MRRADCRRSTGPRSQPSLHCHLRSILPSRRQLASEYSSRAACRASVRTSARSGSSQRSRGGRGLPRRARRLRCSRDRIITPRLLPRMNQCGPHECKGQPEGHHVTAKGRRSRGSVKPDGPEGDGAKRSGLTDPRTAGQSRVVMAAVHATLAHVSELARRSRRAGGRRAGGGDQRPPQSEFRASARSPI